MNRDRAPRAADWPLAERVLAAARRRSPGATPVLLVDANLLDSEITHQAAAWLGVDEAVPVAGAGDVHSVLALADRLAGVPLVVAVGGGSLLDQAKLATLLPDGIGPYLTVQQRSGLVTVPPEIVRSSPLIAIPTTLGTGSEASRVACLAYSDGKRLIAGLPLLPEAAVLDPVAIRTLPVELVREGVLEALARVLNPYVADHRDLPTEDGLGEFIAARLVTTGYQACEGTPDDALRLEIARLSGFTHGEHLCRGGDPYAVKGWLIANELSTALGLRKMTAVAALFPVLWAAIEAGERRLGSPTRLRRIWALLRDAAPRRLPAEPAAGIAELIADWGVDRDIDLTSSQLDDIVRRTVRAWGGGLPMLGGLGPTDVRALLTGATRVQAVVAA